MDSTDSRKSLIKSAKNYNNMVADLKHHGKFSFVLLLLLLFYTTLGMLIFSTLDDCKQTTNQQHKNNSNNNRLNTTATTSSTRDVIQNICSETLADSNKTISEEDLQNLNKKLEVTSYDISRCETNYRLGIWFEFAVATVHAIGYGHTPNTKIGKMITIPYSAVGLIIAMVFYIHSGNFIKSSLAIVVSQFERKVSGSSSKSNIRCLRFKCFCINFLLFVAIVFIASIVTTQFKVDNIPTWIDGLYFWWVTMTTIGNGGYNFFIKSSPWFLLLSLLFLIIGMSLFSANLCILMDSCTRKPNNNRKKNKKHPPCCVSCFGGKNQKRHEEDDVMFKDVSTQKWGSLMSINNVAEGNEDGGAGRGMDAGSMNGGILENVNRVDSQCTIKRLSEIERDRHYVRSDGDSDSENDADDELGIILPIMVTAAVATRRTVSAL